MNAGNIISEVGSLAVSILIAFVVIKHFGSRRYPSSLKYRTFWPRFWGPTIDGVVLWPVTVLLPIVVSGAFPYASRAAWSVSIFVCVCQFAYSIYFNARFGGTIGKFQCRLRIRDHRTEGPISYKQAFMRDAAPITLVVILYAYSAGAASGIADTDFPFYISGIAGIWFLAEILTMLTNRKRRALHDYIAGTVVVRTNIMERRGQVPDAYCDDSNTLFGRESR
jgi:uncharacterized RDD family membrane protein YckC